ncbi:hypothetical protein SNE40_009140 [Patella caerulea]
MEASTTTPQEATTKAGDDCPNGFYGTNCNMRCPTTCLNNTCDKIDGSCSHGCHGDLYGERCNSNCSSHCKDGKCDVRTGRCIGCEDDYYGDMCEESCSTCNGPCRQLDGVCLTDCKDGFWGSNGLCLQTCSYCKPGGCRIENGVCYNGCRGDLYGERCQTNCSNHCKDGKCDDRTGRCFGCEDGYYDDMCDESCSTCNGQCRQLDGVCLTGCKDGYWGCNGLCLQTCSYCNTGGCKIEDGVCYNGCKDGVNNTQCHDGCGSLPPRLNALAESVQNLHPIGAYVNYKCIDGAYLQGSSRARCRPSGEWDIPSFTCTIARTCHEAHQLGASVTPTVVIKPDIELPALTVSCEVTDNGVYTAIGNCGAERTYVQGYEAPRSYNGTINYNLDLYQIINIANASAECEQFIKFECHNVRVISYVGLTTRTGELATYLMGGIKGQMDCACHINNTCVDNLRCNCEKNDNVWRADEGFIRYKEDLPITAILLGDTGSSYEYAYYTVGNLRCKG